MTVVVVPDVSTFDVKGSTLMTGSLAEVLSVLL